MASVKAEFIYFPTPFKTIYNQLNNVNQTTLSLCSEWIKVHSSKSRRSRATARHIVLEKIHDLLNDCDVPILHEMSNDDTNARTKQSNACKTLMNRIDESKRNLKSISLIDSPFLYVCPHDELCMMMSILEIRPEDRTALFQSIGIIMRNNCPQEYGHLEHNDDSLPELCLNSALRSETDTRIKSHNDTRLLPAAGFSAMNNNQFNAAVLEMDEDRNVEVIEYLEKFRECTVGINEDIYSDALFRVSIMNATIANASLVVRLETSLLKRSIRQVLGGDTFRRFFNDFLSSLCYTM